MLGGTSRNLRDALSEVWNPMRGGDPPKMPSMESVSLKKLEYPLF